MRTSFCWWGVPDITEAEFIARITRTVQTDWRLTTKPRRQLRHYRFSPDADPVYLYTDDVIGIVPVPNLNNGQPSLHATLIAAAPQPEEHVVRVRPFSGRCELRSHGL